MAFLKVRRIVAGDMADRLSRTVAAKWQSVHLCKTVFELIQVDRESCLSMVKKSVIIWGVNRVSTVLPFVMSSTGINRRNGAIKIRLTSKTNVFQLFSLHFHRFRCYELSIWVLILFTISFISPLQTTRSNIVSNLCISLIEMYLISKTKPLRVFFLCF